MIRYNPRTWAPLVLGFARSPVLRILLLDVFGVGAYAALVVWLENDVARIPQPFGLPVLSLLGIILGLLLVFRTNTAYDRWWEGRRLWGQLVNCSRALARQLNAMLPKQQADRRNHYTRLLVVFPFALVRHLRTDGANGSPAATDDTQSDWIDVAATARGRDLLTRTDEAAGHVETPSILLTELARSVQQDVASGALPREAIIALMPLLTAFDDVVGACERILRTPIPFGFSSYIRQFVLLFALVVPFAMAAEYGYGTILASMFLFFSTMGVELLATEIEEPFGTDRNDLPLEQISSRIADDVQEILGEPPAAPQT